MAIGRFNLSLTGVQPGGLVYVGGSTFSGATSVSLDNVFSSTYDNYKIVINAVATGTTTGNLIRFRLNGTDDSNALYQMQSLAVDGTSVAAARLTNQTSLFFGDFIGTDRDFIIVEVSAPNLARNTAYLLEQVRRYGTTLTSSVRRVGGHISTTQFDGFSYIVTGSGITMSGEIKVYGYRNDNN